MPAPRRKGTEMGEAGAATIEGRQACRAALRDQLLDLSAGGAAEVWLVDADYEIWPLDDAEVLAALVHWARPQGRRLRMIGRDFAAVERRLPKFSAWRRTWAHAFEARQPAAGEVLELPTLLWAGPCALEVLDTVHWRARRLGEASALRTLMEQIEALSQRCESAWPATTLGL